MSLKPNVSRRELLARVTGVAAATVLTNCGFSSATQPFEFHDPRFSVRPGTPTRSPQLGLHELDFGSERDGLLYVPQSYRADHPLPFVLLLHGAGRRAPELMDPHRTHASDLGIETVLLAVDSRGVTWDAMRTGYGPDIAFIERALGFVFDRCAIDPARVVVTGFSDGASYALALGRANGDLFPRVVAYAPGMLLGVEAVGKPKFFITHGTSDQVLPVEVTRQVIVPSLRDAGYEVDYREWNGGHGVSPELLRDALRFMVA